MTALPLATFIPRHVPAHEDDVFAHAAFLYDLIGITRPSTIVELGTKGGDSYFALCQAILEHNVDCVCYSVVSDEICRTKLGLQNPAQYASYSHWLPAETSAYTFSGIDLLHVTCAATQKIDAWIDQLKPGGFALFSGIDERDKNSRTRLYWEKISAGDRFAFHDGAGFGIWRKPGSVSANSCPLLTLMFDGTSEDQEYVRRHYLIYSGYLRGFRMSTVAERKMTELCNELQASRHELMTLELELKQAQFERNEARREIQRLQQPLPGEEAKAKQLQAELRSLSGLLDDERKTLHGLTHSLSWRVTKPIRFVSEWARGRR